MSIEGERQGSDEKEWKETLTFDKDDRCKLLRLPPLDDLIPVWLMLFGAE